MGADALQTALTTLLAGMTGYTSANCKRADWSVLNAGVSKAIVVEAAPIEYEADGTCLGGDYLDSYDFVVNLCVAYTTDAAADSALAAETDRIKTRLRTYPKLNGTAGVVRAWVAKAEGVSGLFDENGNGPHWWLREITVRVWLEDDQEPSE